MLATSVKAQKKPPTIISADSFGKAGRREQQNREEEAHENNDESVLGPTEVILPSGHVSFTNCATRLFSILKNSNKFYLSSSVVCHLEDKDGFLSLDVVSDYAFRSAIEGFAKLFSWRAGPHEGSVLLKPGARCSLDIAKTILACKARELLPPVAAIHNCP